MKKKIRKNRRSVKVTPPAYSRRKRSNDLFKRKFPLPYWKPQEDFGVLLEKYSYGEGFPKKLLRMGEKINQTYQEMGEEKKWLGRTDLRESVVFTIDGEDAKDFDDAVSISKNENGFELGVHIADVSYFVGLDSPLDLEARKRGTSVYLIDRVLPMFPPVISNDLCSLKEGQERLTVTFCIKIDFSGEIIGYDFSRSVIKSRKRLTYSQVERFLENDCSEDLDSKIVQQLKEMNRLKNLLRQRRMNHGSIDFMTREQRFILQKNKIEQIFFKPQMEAEKLIEEFMLVANRCAALEMKKRGLGIFRIHESPKEDKLLQFEQTLFRKKIDLPQKGYINPLQVKSRKIKPNRLMLFLNTLDDPAKKQFYSFLLLRSMNQAKYSVENVGHYGLAFKNYTHFTSPIRRYPDLMVHRILFGVEVRGSAMRAKNLREIALTASTLERKAVDAERDYRKLKSMRYLEERKEVFFQAMITGFHSKGLFVQDKETGIEGMLSYSYLDPLLQINDQGNALVYRDEIVYELGGSIKVKLLSFNFSKLQINVALSEESKVID